MELLVPSDVVEPRWADEHFVDEARAARELGVVVHLLDHDALVAGRATDAVRRVGAGDDLVYRGWMVGAAAYAELASALADRGAELRTSPDSFRSGHELPGWYDAFVGLTAPSAWTVGPDLDAFRRALGELPPGGAVVKDHVKSLKHHWDTAMYVPDLADEAAALRVAEAFLAERGDDLVGGLVVRAFESYRPGEARSWWVAGSCALVSVHPDADGEPVPSVPTAVLDEVAAAIDRLGAPFVTADLAQTVDGAWRVVEVGDGQVSDRPRSVDPALLLGPLLGS